MPVRGDDSQDGLETRPYERYKGDTDQKITKSVAILADAFLGNRSKEDAVAEVVSNFEDIKIVRHSNFRPRPKVAIFGDLYARDNHVFNQGLIHLVEENGGEVITTPYSDYLKMISRPYVRKWLIEGHYLSAFSSQALLSTLKWKEPVYYQYFERILNEPMPEYREFIDRKPTSFCSFSSQSFKRRQLRLLRIVRGSTVSKTGISL